MIRASVLASTLLVLTAACGDRQADPHSPMPPTIDWRIEPGRVGAVELGKPMPPFLLERDLERHYIARYIADAQPMDAFQFDDPPLTIVLSSGPFADESLRHDVTTPPPTERLRGRAAIAARAGMLVRALLVNHAGPATAEGVGVASTFEELRRAYPDLELSPFPEILGEDTCVARALSLPGVAFVFETCDKAKLGDLVKRVDLWP